MELNRNQYFLIGLVIVFLGAELRMVDTFVLNDRATHFIHQRVQQMKGQQVASTSEISTVLATQSPAVKRRINPPDWLGYSLLSVGSVLVIYSLALKKPGG
jgi:hypothetical protein